MTAENQLAPWLNFEAGALAKAVDESRVVPLAIDLKPSDVKLPLGQFQAQPATADGARAIVLSMNSALDAPLVGARLEKALGKWWPDLEMELGRIERDAAPRAATERPDRELLEEILNTVRGIARPASNTEPVSLEKERQQVLAFAQQFEPALRIVRSGTFSVYVVAPEGAELHPEALETIREFGEARGVAVEFRRLMSGQRPVPLG